MKFVIALLALVACAAANYVTPYVSTAYTSPVVTGVAAYPWATAVHYRARRQVYSPAVYTSPVVGAAGYYPYAAVHYRERRQIYTPTVYTAPAVGYAQPWAAVHYRERRQIYSPLAYAGTPLAHTAYNTPFSTNYY